MAAEMSAIDRAKKHFASTAPDPFEVPELGLTVYPKHETLADRFKRRELVQRKDYDKASAYAYTVILLAMDEHGKPLFKPGDRLALITECDPDLVEDIAVKCMGGTEEDAEKN